MEAVRMKIKVRCLVGEMLKAEGRSQTWLADKIGAHVPLVNDWCTGKTNPSIGYILRIQRVTGWRLEDMFKEE